MEPLSKSTSLNMPEEFEDLEKVFLGRDFRQPYSRHSEDLDACPLSSLYERMTGEPVG